MVPPLTEVDGSGVKRLSRKQRTKAEKDKKKKDKRDC